MMGGGEWGWVGCSGWGGVRECEWGEVWRWYGRVRRWGNYGFNWVAGLDESRVIRCN